MPNEIKKLPYALSVAVGQSDNMKRKSISQSSPTALIWTISGIILVACSSDGSRSGTSRVLPNGAEGDPIVRGTLGLSDPVPPSDLKGDYGTLKFDPDTKSWTYTLGDGDPPAIQMLLSREQAIPSGEQVIETFTFTNDGSDDTEDVVITVTATLLDDEGEETNIELSYDPDVGIIATSTETGFYTIKVVLSGGKGTESIVNFSVVLFPDVTNLTKVLGDGGVDAVIGNDEATSHQFLLGGNNAQTLNAGEGGDVIFGGRGDDIINLGNGSDIVVYRYDGADKTDSEASDGADVINDFDLDEDVLVLAHESNDVHENPSTFYEAVKGISLLVDGDGNVTGIVFTFTDRSDTTQEVDLTVNFSSVFSASSSQTTAINAAFEDVVSGKREITSGQETAAYGVINEIFGGNLVLIDFADIGFELNPAETDIEDEDVIASSRVLLNEDQDDPIFRGTIGLPNPVPPTDLVGNYGTLKFDPDTKDWTYTPDNTATQMLQPGEQVTETFTFTDVSGLELEVIEITLTGRLGSLEELNAAYNNALANGLTVTFTLFDENGNLTNIGLSYDPDVGIIADSTETGFYTVRAVVSDGQITESIVNLSVVLFPDVTNLTKVLGDGVVDAVIGNDEATSHQFLLGGDNAQTLNAGEGGDVIFGGRGDDIINLGNGSDIVVYRYDGTGKTNLVAYDGSDVINNFSLVEDVILLAHTEDTGSVSDFDTDTALLEAVKGISLLVDESGDITGIVLTFINRETPTQDINLTVNFENDGFISSEDIDLTAFNEAVGGKRTIKAGQEAAAHQALIASEDESTVVLPINFMDLGFELNPAETDIV